MEHVGDDVGRGRTVSQALDMERVRSATTVICGITVELHGSEPSSRVPYPSQATPAHLDLAAKKKKSIN